MNVFLCQLVWVMSFIITILFSVKLKNKVCIHLFKANTKNVKFPTMN